MTLNSTSSEIAKNWRNGVTRVQAQNNNNGKLRLSVRQAAKRLGVCKATAAKMFHELQAKGFLVVTEPGSLGLNGNARGPAYAITELALPDHLATKFEGYHMKYLKWKPGSDFPVQKTPTNNPRGNNGKTKPRLIFSNEAS